MGVRLSRPSSPSGSEEAAKSSLTTTTPGAPTTSSGPRAQRRPPRTIFGIPRHLVFAPLSAILLGSIFYVYSRTTVAAAKENARRAREADGGSISWRREGMRRHGTLQKYEEKSLWNQLTGRGTEEKVEETEREKALRKELDRNPIEEGIRRARDEKRRAMEQAQKPQDDS